MTQENTDLINRWVQKVNEEAEKLNEANAFYLKMLEEQRKVEFEKRILEEQQKIEQNLAKGGTSASLLQDMNSYGGLAVVVPKTTKKIFV